MVSDEKCGYQSGRSSTSSGDSTVTECGCLSIVVLGASGDLAKKKTFPALFNLFCEGFLPEQDVHIFGYARTPLSNDDLRRKIQEHLKPRGGTPEKDFSTAVSKFLDLVAYISGPYDKDEGFVKLDEEIAMHERKKSGEDGPSRRLFYLALPPSVYPSVCKRIRDYCMNQRLQCHNSAIVIPHLLLIVVTLIAITIIRWPTSGGKLN